MHSLKNFEGDEQNKKKWTEREIGWWEIFFEQNHQKKNN